MKKADCLLKLLVYKIDRKKYRRENWASLHVINLLIFARPQRQTIAEGCRIFGDLDQLKSKDTTVYLF